MPQAGLGTGTLSAPRCIVSPPGPSGGAGAAQRTLPRLGKGEACWLEPEGHRTLLRLAGGCAGCHSPLFASVSLSFPIINVSPSSLKHLRRGIFLLPLLLFFLFIFSFYFTELLPAAPQTSNSPRVLLAAGCVWPPRLLPPTLRAPDCFCWLFAGETKNPPKTKQPPGVLFGPEEWGTDPGAGGPRAPRMALGPLNQMPPNTPLGFDAP